MEGHRPCVGQNKGVVSPVSFLLQRKSSDAASRECNNIRCLRCRILLTESDRHPGISVQNNRGVGSGTPFLAIARQSALPQISTEPQTSLGSVTCRKEIRAPQRTPSFDHLVGNGEQFIWNGDAERLCGLEIDHELVVGGPPSGAAGSSGLGHAELAWSPPFAGAVAL